MVTSAAAARRVLRHARIRGAHAAGADRVAATMSSRWCRSRIGRKGAGRSCSRRRRNRPRSTRRVPGAAAGNESGTTPSCARYRDLRVDLGVVAAYGRILPDALLAIPPLGMINVHASLLPAYRGAAPVHRAVIDGLAETGVTIMRVVRELDAGPMLAPGDASDRARRDQRRGRAWRWRELGAGLLLDVVEQLAAGTAKEEPQDDSAATYAPKITRERRDDRLGAAGGGDPQPRARTAALAARVRPARRPPLPAPPDQLTTAVRAAAAGHDRRSRRRIAGGRRRRRRHCEILQIQPEGRRVMSSAGVSRRIPDSSGDDLRAVIAPARLAAYDVLRAVSTRRADLPAALARARSHLHDERDRALAGEIATGTLRWQGAFDDLIAAYARRPLDDARCRGRRHPPADAVSAAPSRSGAGVGGRQRRRATRRRRPARRAPRRSSTRCSGARAASATACRCRRARWAMPRGELDYLERRCRIRAGWWSDGGRGTGSRRLKPGAGSTTSRRR